MSDICFINRHRSGACRKLSLFYLWHSCPGDWRISASCGPNWRPSLSHTYNVHHSSIALRGIRRSPHLGPHDASRRQLLSLLSAQKTQLDLTAAEQKDFASIRLSRIDNFLSLPNSVIFSRKTNDRNVIYIYPYIEAYMDIYTCIELYMHIHISNLIMHIYVYVYIYISKLYACIYLIISNMHIYNMHIYYGLGILKFSE